MVEDIREQIRVSDEVQSKIDIELKEATEIRDNIITKKRDAESRHNSLIDTLDSLIGTECK